MAFGPYRLLPGQKLLLRDGRAVRLGGRAFDLLHLLVLRAGSVVSRKDLTAWAWPGLFVDETNLRVHIAALRRILGEDDVQARYITTMAGRGYCFVAPVSGTAPPEAGVAQAVHSLPMPLGRIYGREDAIASLVGRLAEDRFVTLVGQGGIGKTTVAVAAAGRLASELSLQAQFLDLGPLTDPRLVIGTLVGTLGLESSGGNPLAALQSFLATRQMLLLFDSCEHLVTEVAEIAVSLLRAAPGLLVLATSREPLRADGEWVQRLEPLPTPVEGGDLTADQALNYPAVALFAARGAASCEGFTLSDRDAPLVIDICRRLDGNPLALELAAGNLPHLGPAMLAQRIGERFGLAMPGRRTGPPRQRTLRATLDWSFKLLPPEEQALLRRLGILRGPFSLETAIAVAGVEEADSVLLRLAALADKSLVSVDVGGHDMTYRLLDATRAYAAEKLRESGDHDATAERHARHLHDELLRLHETNGFVSDDREAQRRLLNEVHVALDWAFSAAGQSDLAVSLTIAAVPLWMRVAFIDVCRRRVDQALAALGSGTRSAAAMQLYEAMGVLLLHIRGAGPEMEACWSKVLEIAESQGNLEFILRALWGLMLATMHAPLRRPLAFAQRFYREAQASTDPADVAIAERMLGYVHHLMGNQIEAETRTRRMLALYVDPGDARHLLRYNFEPRVSAEVALAQIEWLRGAPDAAAERAELALALALKSGHVPSLFYAITRGAGSVHLLNGAIEAAERALKPLSAELSGYGTWRLWTLAYGGIFRIRRGAVEEGVQMLAGAIQAMPENSFGSRNWLFHAELAEALTRLGRASEALSVLDLALARSARVEYRWFDPELMRLRGENLRARGAVADAKLVLEEALELARAQGAVAWVRRLQGSLARPAGGAP
ncbi:ATP-binding protein [Roseomonas sp. F4]